MSESRNGKLKYLLIGAVLTVATLFVIKAIVTKKEA